MIETCAVGRAGTPDEVGNVAALLMGPDGGFVTGSDFLMDGGVTAAYLFGEAVSQGQSGRSIREAWRPYSMLCPRRRKRAVCLCPKERCMARDALDAADRRGAFIRTSAHGRVEPNLKSRAR